MTLLKQLTVPRFFDAHVHVRQSQEELNSYVPWTARICDHCLVMPNTEPPITDGQMAMRYYSEIMAAAGLTGCTDFQPLLTLYLTTETAPKEIEQAVKLCKYLAGVKLYPLGATTNSKQGIPFDWLHVGRPGWSPDKFKDVLKVVADNDLVLNIHGEDPDASLLERESAFINTLFCDWYLHTHTGARLCLEHISTNHGLLLVKRLFSRDYNIAGSLTLHHLCHTINDAYGQPHHCCWPPLNTDFHRGELLHAARFGAENWPFFLGSDSAPHAVAKKHCAKAACGCYTSPALAGGLAALFTSPDQPESEQTEERIVQRLTRFSSVNAQKFYRVKPSGRTLTLEQEPWQVPDQLDAVIPWGAGKTVLYRLSSEKEAVRAEL